MAKPLIFPDNRSAADRFDPSNVKGHDPSYVGGYSEIVQANDIAASDDLKFLNAHAGTRTKRKEDVYKLIGTGPQELDCQLSWQRVASPSGSHSYSAAVQLMNAEQEGWRAATLDDLKNRGFGMPPTAHVAADGTIRRLDTALHIRDGEVARKWERFRAEEAARAEGSSFPAHLQADRHATETIWEKKSEPAS